MPLTLSFKDNMLLLSILNS